MLKGVQHCALVVGDLERSRWFYGEALGMDEIPRPSNFTFAGAWFRAGGQELHLIAAHDTTSPAGWQDPGPSALAGLAAHVALEVDDLDGAAERIALHGVDVFAGPMKRGDGVVQFYVRDPDAHLIELFERTGQDQRSAAERAPVRA